ncbi:MAG: hypothetical protein ACTHZF_09515, partial [Psychrobacter sp.]
AATVQSTYNSNLYSQADLSLCKSTSLLKELKMADKSKVKKLKKEIKNAKIKIKQTKKDLKGLKKSMKKAKKAK